MGPDRPVTPRREAIDTPGGGRSKLVSAVVALRRRMEQLAALREAEPQAAAQIARLERVLDFDRVAAHLRGAVAEAALIATPVPHLIVPALAPPDVYQALVDVIPAPLFFDNRLENGLELRMPPRVAPTASIVAWMFVNDIVQGVLGSLLVERFAEPLAVYAQERFPSLPPFCDWDVEIALLAGRFLRRVPGYLGGSRPEQRWDFVTGVWHLARGHDSEEYGSRLGASTIPFRANSALIYVPSADKHTYDAIPAGVSADIERYTYEFGIGPTGGARRSLSAMMAPAPVA